MTRYERKIYSFGVVIAAILIIAIVAVLTEGCGAETAVYAAPMCAVEDFTEEESELAKMPQFDDQSAMPCDDPESFRRWLENYEPTAAEEEANSDCDVHDTESSEHGYDESSCVEEEQATVEADIPIYSIAGVTMSPYLQRLLYYYLDNAGISYWYEIGLCEMWQESQGYIYAINPVNHEDMGLFQYKSRYWDWSLGDIFDVDAQFKLYSEQMAARLNSGLSVDECISRHKTSDYVTEMDWKYVSDVKKHLPTMREAK